MAVGDRTGIEWTDATWNPVTGCTKVSPGCDRCYAETLAERFRGVPGHYYEQGFDVVLRPDKLEVPLRWRRPRRVFVNSMSDLFHRDVPDEYIARVFAVMARAPQHTFQVLTKRHGRMRSLLSSAAFHNLVNDLPGEPWRPLVTFPLPNVWLGVSVEDQQRADLRIPALLDTPATVRFLSCEPLLGPLDLRLYLHTSRGVETRGWGIDWVIVGGESGRGARPMYPTWVRLLRAHCADAGVPFTFKQWGEWAPSQARVDQQGFVWPDGTFEVPPVGHIPTRPGWINVERVGKKRAGRELDGRTHDDAPALEGGGAA